MASLLLQHLPFLYLHCFIVIAAASPKQIPKPHVVYMGSTSSNREDVELAETAYLQLLSSIIPSKESERISLIHHYKHSFRGFSAMLSEEEASVLSEHEGVVSVFPDPILEVHTTRSWDFLEAEEFGITRSTSWSSAIEKYRDQSSDIIIGIIDTGIWPESPSFNDQGMGKIPSRWNGVCMGGPDFKKSNCNRKLIGARFYKTNSGSPRDSEGHGTHTASTAAGAYVTDVSYFGLARGTARGGSPYSRIAIYKACQRTTCSGAAISQAIDDAIGDGVNIISISIGPASSTPTKYLEDSIAIAAFSAEKKGIMVVCSAGNSGPDPFTVKNTAPWIFTVGASTIDRDFQSTVLLGNGKLIKGTAISLPNLSRSNKRFPLAYGKNIAAKSTVESQARSCHPESLDPNKVAGKIVVCSPSGKIDLELIILKSEVLILVNDDEKIRPSVSMGILPFAEVGRVSGSQIIEYINSNKDPTATISPSETVQRHKPAPVVAYFSSRGPCPLTQNILKPDVTAPGVAILAATVPKANTLGGIPAGENPATYDLSSGTSVACPHVAGVVAIIKSVRPNWSNSMIKSALMTTATDYDNTDNLITNSSGNYANAHEMGAGEIKPLRALHPGLVFETSVNDYLRFLCYYGYSDKKIRTMNKKEFHCPEKSTEKLISNINYPSISISEVDRHGDVITVNRTATNVGSPDATYTVSVNAPPGLSVTVIPHKLVFVKGVESVSFRVSFGAKQASTGYHFGSIRWSDKRYSVRMVFAVNVK